MYARPSKKEIMIAALPLLQRHFKVAAADLSIPKPHRQVFNNVSHLMGDLHDQFTAGAQKLDLRATTEKLLMLQQIAARDSFVGAVFEGACDLYAAVELNLRNPKNRAYRRGF